jgi:predicted CXXCH cytochrome family protein
LVLPFYKKVTGRILFRYLQSFKKKRLTSMPSNKLVLAICALSLFLVAASAPLIKSPAADAKESAGIRLIVPESLSFAVSGPGQNGGKRGRMSYQPATTSEKKIMVVGEAEDGTQPEIEIVDNGQHEVTPVFHDQYFHARVPLSLGMNKIEVRWRRNAAGGPASGGWNVEAISIYRFSKDQGPPNEDYPPYAFHTAEKEKQCKLCHKMTSTPEDIDSGTDNTCLACHADLQKNVHVHGPVGAGMCLACHNPKSKPSRYRIGKDDNVLCYSCHEDRKETDTKHKLMHGPVAAGMCTVCHDPHSSPNDYQLIKPKNELCVMCHQEDADRWLGRPSLHPPFERGECYRCHDPHSSDYQYNLKANRKDLCKLCHTMPVPGHWHDNWARTPLFELPDDLPLDDQGKVMCLTCHDPHGAEGDHLTRRAGCHSCHAITPFPH